MTPASSMLTRVFFIIAAAIVMIVVTALISQRSRKKWWRLGLAPSSLPATAAAAAAAEQDSRITSRIGLSLASAPLTRCETAGYTGLYCEACTNGLDYPLTHCMRDPPLVVAGMVRIPLVSRMEIFPDAVVYIATRTWTNPQYTAKGPVRVPVQASSILGQPPQQHLDVPISSIITTTLPVQFALCSSADVGARLAHTRRTTAPIPSP